MLDVTAAVAGLTISGGILVIRRAAAESLNIMVIYDKKGCDKTSSGEYGGGVYNDGSGGSATLTILNSITREIMLMVGEAWTITC